MEMSDCRNEIRRDSNLDASREMGSHVIIIALWLLVSLRLDLWEIHKLGEGIHMFAKDARHNIDLQYTYIGMIVRVVTVTLSVKWL